MAKKKPGETRIVRTVRDGDTVGIGETDVKVQRRRGRIKLVVTGPASVRYRFPEKVVAPDDADL